MNTQNKIIEIHGKELTTTSLIIADLFGRPHKNVLQSLDKLSSKNKELTFKPIDYIDKNGETKRALQLNERQFLIAMPFIGGLKSMEGQIKLVDEFMRLRAVLNEPNRKQAIQSKRDAAKPMTDMLKFCRDEDGKKTNHHHYSNEHLFCNRAAFGSWLPVVEAELDTYDARLLDAVRNHNTLLIARYPDQKDRKSMLEKFVTEYKEKRPRLMLVK